MPRAIQLAGIDQCKSGELRASRRNKVCSSPDLSRDNLDEKSGNQDENDGSPSPMMIVASAAGRKQFLHSD
jgi:hypothetical protein